MVAPGIQKLGKEPSTGLWDKRHGRGDHGVEEINNSEMPILTVGWKRQAGAELHLR